MSKYTHITNLSKNSQSTYWFDDLYNCIDRILLGATTPSQSRSGSDGNEGVLRIPQSSRVIGTSHYLGWGSYPSAKVLSVYSTAPPPAD